MVILPFEQRYEIAPIFQYQIHFIPPKSKKSNHQVVRIFTDQVYFKQISTANAVINSKINRNIADDLLKIRTTS